MSTLKPTVVTGEIFYASDMVQFNDYTAPQQKYVAQIGNLSEEDADKLRSMGIYVGQNEAKGLYVTCKSKHKHDPKDVDGNSIDPLTIGNGSKCKVGITAYEWKFGKKAGVGASAKFILVTDLIKYVPSVKTEEAEAEDIL